MAAEGDAGRALDVLGGAAGAISVLVRAGGEPLLRLARALGEILLASAEYADGAASWNTVPVRLANNLTGYSHGASGIALALLELWKATRDQRVFDAALAGIEYERRLFHPGERNWPDFRFSQSESDRCHRTVAWCHGAAGIGLARLRMYEITGLPSLKTDAIAALDRTSREVDRVLESPTDFCLCHGLAGLADFFLDAHQTIDESRASVAYRVARYGIERILRRGLPWPGGNPSGQVSPGLLTGLAGIGHFYLRLVAPREIPSVLLVKGP